VILGALGPWQKAPFGASASGLEFGPVILVPTVLLAGYAVYEYDRGREDRRERIGVLLIVVAALLGFAEFGNIIRMKENPAIGAGWGSIVAGIGGAGLLTAGIWLRSAGHKGK